MMPCPTRPLTQKSRAFDRPEHARTPARPELLRRPRSLWAAALSGLLMGAAPGAALAQTDPFDDDQLKLTSAQLGGTDCWNKSLGYSLATAPLSGVDALWDVAITALQAMASDAACPPVRLALQTGSMPGTTGVARVIATAQTGAPILGGALDTVEIGDALYLTLSLTGTATPGLVFTEAVGWSKGNLCDVTGPTTPACGTGDTFTLPAPAGALDFGALGVTVLEVGATPVLAVAYRKGVALYDLSTPLGPSSVPSLTVPLGVQDVGIRAMTASELLTGRDGKELALARSDGHLWILALTFDGSGALSVLAQHTLELLTPGANEQLATSIVTLAAPGGSGVWVGYPQVNLSNQGQTTEDPTREKVLKVTPGTTSTLRSDEVSALIPYRGALGRAMVAADFDGDGVDEVAVSRTFDNSSSLVPSQIYVVDEPGQTIVATYTDPPRAPIGGGLAFWHTQLGRALAVAPEICLAAPNGSYTYGLVIGAPEGPSSSRPPVILVCPAQHIDRDNDAVPVTTDCDDDDMDVHPGAEDAQCDGVDNDCDDAADEDADRDGDTFFDPALCPGKPADCDDGERCEGVLDPAACLLVAATVHAGAEELCDALDNDCDDVVDEGFDKDGDGFLSADAPECAGLLVRKDCDDGDPEIHPDAPELCNGHDDDCDADTDEDFDIDGDGAVSSYLCKGEETCPGCPVGTDCNDGATCDDADDPGACLAYAASSYEGSIETCGELDEDCDGDIGEDIAEGEGDTYLYDADGDGYGYRYPATDPRAPTLFCGAPGGGKWVKATTSNLEDCDDNNIHINPGAVELCAPAGIDENCDGFIDNEAPYAQGKTSYFFDADGDGYGSKTVPSQPFCAPPPPGWIPQGGDCDDNDVNTNPAKVELCDRKDNDCNGFIDDVDEADLQPWYSDADGDGYGVTEDDPVKACLKPEGKVPASGDCDDQDPSVNPGSPERCTAAGRTPVNEDCDGETDEGAAMGSQAWYPDKDGDGYGSSSSAPTLGCIQPTGGPWATSQGDCNDHDPYVSPDGVESCCEPGSDWAREDACQGVVSYLAVDDDCDGLVDEGLDKDGDHVLSCVEELPGADSTSGCDDDFQRGPQVQEVCDLVDNDCDGEIDEGFDLDGDGYRGCAYSVGVAHDPADDCDDYDASVYPGAAEACDLRDNDCDGRSDEDPSLYVPASPTSTATVLACIDTDGDHFCPGIGGRCADGSTPGDCSELSAALNPDAPEICDGIDNNCDAVIDDSSSTIQSMQAWYLDNDGDGYGSSAIGPTFACAPPEGAYVTQGGDCDDGAACGGDECVEAAAQVHPGADETCDPALSIDEDCDGVIDEIAGGLDRDGDGWADCAETTRYPLQESTGCFVPQADCADDPTRNPDRIDTCNGYDDDCDGLCDEEADQDGDGSPSCDLSAFVAACDAVSWCERGDLEADCDDLDGGVHPGAEETCDAVDEDCDGETDEGDDLDRDGDGSPDCLDDDQDGYCEGFTASATPALCVCVVTAKGEVRSSCFEVMADAGATCADGSIPGDCDDRAPFRHPQAAEGQGSDGQGYWYGNGVDDDCDCITDELTRDFDTDHDGYTIADGDCVDTDASVYPGADEAEDHKDNDCDNKTDEHTRTADDDGDGYCEGGTTDDHVPLSCVDGPDGRPLPDGDCNDNDNEINPEATEECDDVDHDCDGTLDNGFVVDANAGRTCDDDDGDGFSEDGSVGGALDCDDTREQINPASDEVACTELDEDCDHRIDEVPGACLVGGGCGGCDSSAAPPSTGVIALLWVAIRRRRSRGSDPDRGSVDACAASCEEKG